MKNSKRILAALLIANLCASAISLPAYAEEAEGESGKTYDVNIVIEGKKETTEVETKPGLNETVEIETKYDVTENKDGSTTTKTESSADNFTTESGMIVDYKGSSEITEIPKVPAEGETTEEDDSITLGTAKEEYTAVSPDGTYGATGGSKLEIKESFGSDITVDIPLTSEDNPATEDVIENHSKAEGEIGDPVIKGEIKESPEDGKYNYTVTETVKPGEVTVTTQNIEITESVDSTKNDLDYVASETKPTKDNDLLTESGSAADEQYLPGPGVESGDKPADELGAGYEFVYVGTGNTSQFAPAIIYTTPLSEADKVALKGMNYVSGAYINVKDGNTKHFISWLDEETQASIAKNEDGSYKTDGEGYVLDTNGNRVTKAEKTIVGPDGTVYYLHRFDANGELNYVEGWYEDGEWVVDLNTKADRVKNSDGTYTYYLLDEEGERLLDENGEEIAVYATPYKYNGYAQYGAVYATSQQFVLVDKETGEVITTYCADSNTTAEYGYGYNVKNLEDAKYYTDEQAAMIRTIANNGYWGNAEGSGSLTAVREMLAKSNEFTADEIAALTDGIALTATQMAIWSFSNKMNGIQFVGGQYVADGKTAGNKFEKYIPESEEADVKLMMKLYEYLVALDPTPAPEAGNQTTANTIINPDHFLKDLDITVVGKSEAEEYAAVNTDGNRDNDAYVTNLTFSLVVKPSTANGDDLIVKVFSTDKNGKPVEVASARIAGENKEGEDYQYIEAVGDNYTLEGITITEGGNTFNITLEGIQNLEQGVYLYSSEVRPQTYWDNNGNYYGKDDAVASQTLVGLAQGERAVNVSMSINFDLNVEDEIVATEHIWREEWVEDPEIPEDDPETPEEDPETPEEDPEIPEDDPETPEEDPETPEEDPEIPEDDPVDPVDPVEEPVVIIEDTPIPEAEPEVIIEDEDIPLTDIPDEPVPTTGDSFFWHICSAIAALGLSAVTFFDKKRKNGENA